MKPKSDHRDILEKLKRLSLDEKIAKQNQAFKAAVAANLTSQYQLNFRPMPVGVRKRLWEEGYRYRNQRKKNGFNHFKLEWKLATDRR